MVTDLSRSRRWGSMVRAQLVVLAISVAMCEIALHVLAASPMGAVLEPTPAMLPDIVLGSRGNPDIWIMMREATATPRLFRVLL
jgi:hypothetical protein